MKFGSVHDGLLGPRTQATKICHAIITGKTRQAKLLSQFLIIKLNLERSGLDMKQKIERDK